MWRSLLILAALAGLAASSAIQRTPREKKNGFSAGSLATIVGTLTLLKIKAVFVTLVVLAIAAVFSRFLGMGMGCGAGGDLGLGCAGALLTPTAHAATPASGYSQYDQYNSYYNHRAAKSVQGWDLVDLSLEALGLESEDCKKKFVCLADNEAIDNPFLQLFMQTVGSGLSKYREESSGEEARDCDQLFPACTRDLSQEAREDQPTNKLPRSYNDTNINR